MSQVTYKDKHVDAADAKTRKVRGGGTIEVPAVSEYDYKVAEFTFVDGDTTGEKTFIDVFESLFKGNYKSGVKALVKGWNFYAKKNAAPKSDAKKLKALRTLAESLGLSLAEIQAKLGV